LLGDVAEQAPDGHAVDGGVVPEHGDHPGGDRQQGGEAADGGGLARAVGSEEAEDLALGDGEVEPVDGPGVPEGV